MNISYRATIVAVVTSTTLLLACESREAEKQRREFVTAFVQSVYDGTDFYRQHLDGTEEPDAPEKRELMSRDFSITHIETFGLFPWRTTAYEYYLRFSNGADGVLYLSEKKGKRRAALSVSRGVEHE